MNFYLWILPFFVVGLCKADVPDFSELTEDIDDLEAIKERCDKKGGVGTYDKIKKAKDETQTCIQGLIDVNKVEEELNEAKKTGSMDEVFGKYCAKKPEFKNCIDKSVDAVHLCMEESEKQALNVTLNIVSQIVDFGCYKNGDRLAMFVAEGGVKCVQNRTDAIKTCFNNTVKFDPSSWNINTVPDLTIDKKKCDDLSTIQECVVKDLEEKCADTTPANIIDALFRFVKKSACKDFRQRRSVSMLRMLLQ